MEPVKDHQGMKIIGIDNGYGNIKTANCCFPAGLTAHNTEPVFKDDLLTYDGRYYLIGAGHKEFTADKTGDDDYYILTLAAIARELNVHGLTDATVRLAVGLPLTWVSRQREDFKVYLTRNREPSFIFRGKAYRVEIAGVDVFPQGFAAVAGQIRDFQGFLGMQFRVDMNVYAPSTQSVLTRLDYRYSSPFISFALTRGDSSV